MAKAAKTDPTIKVVNVSLALGARRRPGEGVRQLVKRDVVVVAASGNRPQDETDYGFADYDAEPTDGDGEDAADDFFPAGYHDVVAVNATAGGLPTPTTVDVRGFVLQNSATDVAAPTYDAVTRRTQRRHLPADEASRRRGRRPRSAGSSPCSGPGTRRTGQADRRAPEGHRQRHRRRPRADVVR